MSGSIVGAVGDYRVRAGPWRFAWLGAAALGAVGLLGAGAGFVLEPQRAPFSYLFAFASVLTIALGALFFVLVQHLVGAGWSVSVRRLAELLASGLVVLAVLFVPVLMSVKTLYPWADHSAAPAPHAPSPSVDAHGEPALGPGAGEDPVVLAARHAEEAHLVEKKAPYLNVPFFAARAVAFLALWSLLGLRLWRLSTRQDLTRTLVETQAAQRMAPWATVAFGVTLTFAGVDWLMSLAPTWYSTIWGVYVFSSGVVAMLAVLALWAVGLRRAGVVGEAVTTEHLHDVGKLLFGFGVFWAYIAFSQFFLIWYANIPEELAFYHRRWTDGGPWREVSLVLVFGHFVLPFAVLLSRNAKRRPALLGLGAAVVLVMHLVEMYWVVMPNAGPFAPSWVDAACVLAVAGPYAAWVLRALTQHSVVPVGDPRLVRALQFTNS